MAFVENTGNSDHSKGNGKRWNRAPEYGALNLINEG